MIRNGAEIVGYVGTPAAIVWTAVKSWPLLRRQSDLVHDVSLAQEREKLEGERRKISDERADMMSALVDTLRASNEGWRKAIEELSSKIDELKHKQIAAVQYIAAMVVWGRSVSDDPMPEIPVELQDDVDEAIRGQEHA